MPNPLNQTPWRIGWHAGLAAATITPNLGYNQYILQHTLLHTKAPKTRQKLKGELAAYQACILLANLLTLSKPRTT